MSNDDIVRLGQLEMTTFPSFQFIDKKYGILLAQGHKTRKLELLTLNSLSFLFLVILLIYFWLFYLFTFEMLSPFPVSPLQTPHPISLPFASMRVLHPPTHPPPTSTPH